MIAGYNAVIYLQLS